MAKETKKIKKEEVLQSIFGISISRLGPLLALLGTLLYLQTTTFKFTQDDAIVITENMFTSAGIKGIAGLFKYDTFYGYFKDQAKTKLVSGGRYRPLTPAMFAFEYDLAGPNPWLSHFISAICYGLLCWILFGFLRELLTPRLSSSTAVQVALFASLVFALHPIHTEAVANIKGRDEIVAAMGALGAMWLMLRSVQSANPFQLRLAAGVVMLFGLLAKENIITVLAIAPLTLWWYHKNTPVKWISNLWPIIAACILFIVIRGAATGWGPSEAPKELMNNPFLKVENGVYIPFSAGEKTATIVYTMGKYIQLLVFPYPLTHDYYPRHIEIQHWGKPMVVLYFLFWLGLLFLVIKGWKKRTWWAYGILFYVSAMSITSNIVFPIGTNMSERFAFFPSVGFALIAGYIISLAINAGYRRAILLASLLLFVGYSGWTMARSRVWKDNTTLFTSDIKTSGRSAKLLNAVGGDLITRAEDEKDEKVKMQMLTDAQGYLKRAIEIHPNYKLSYLLLGNSYFHMKDLDQAVVYFRHVLKMDPEYQDGKRNLGIALRDQGKIQGEKNNNLVGAITLLQEAVQYLPDDFETYQLLGVAYGQQGDFQKAIGYFKKEIELAPKNATAQYNLGIAYRHAGDITASEACFDAAKALDPNLPQLKNR